ncbi:TonB-dependent siderophore receptor [Flavobacterium sp. SUN046]|uniref:TonB-dependent siderophore receptor n=1 Tax=Flavobacterium sp. SUN046 TaxID=3002440 RepID=UPI002DB9A5B4|nr:TonB-dependent siderophore receptor [Flavobacterium sp. SUN046]MEC4049181.1 TonB-dependent siderophore receptor [Flavobacterium sp. SUN046]
MYKYNLLSAFALLMSVSSFAQETKNNEDLYAVNDTVKNKGGILKEVIVTTKTKNQPTVVRSGIKPMDLPQSIQVITGAVIEQQQSVRLSDVVKNANGVYVGSARGGAQESFWSRGYDMTANNMFKNGFRFNGGSIPEVASLDKVEILKGSSALLYGNVAPGGILNMVTKSPLFKKGGEIGMQAGSYDFYKPSLDIYGPLNQSIAYRFVGTYENSESFRNVVKKERYYVNPSFLFKLSEKSEIILQGDYLNDDWTPDFGTGSIGREVANIPRNTYLGAKWSNGNTKQATVSALVNHQLNSKWKFNFNSSYQNYIRTSEGTERILPTTNGDWNRPLGKNKAVEEIFSQQVSLQGNFNTGKIKHQLFTGIDIENSFADAYTFVFNPANYDLINIYNLDLYPQSLDIQQATNTKIVKTETNRYGIYAQDLISLTDKFKVLAGVRYSLQETKPITYDLVANTVVDETIRNDRAFSPKAGLIYQPTKNTTLFTSYSNSFTPNTGITIFNEALKPSLIDQYEIGVKNDFWKGILSTNVTVYQIVNSNLAQTAEFNANGTINTNTNVKSLSGETTSKGIEFDITARPLPSLNIMAGYSYNNMEYSKTTGATGSFIEGDRLVRTPQNTANLSAFYTVSAGKLKGLSLGTMANYIGDRFGGYNNTINQAASLGDRTIPLSGYTTIDFSMGYTWNKFSLLCKLSNITNELNYTVHENYSVNPIAPRQILTSLKYKF